MLKAKEMLESRVEEVNLYFDFLYKVIDRRAELSLERPFVAGEPDERDVEHISSSVLNTLKANGFLLLYNMVEATVRLAIGSIRDFIESQGHSFDDLHGSMRSFLASQMSNDGVRGMVMKSPHPVGKAILIAGFDAGRLLGGNIHHDTLQNIGKKFGFSVETDPALTKGGKRLTEVKEKRNQLAHGHLSFIECGRDTPIDEIIEIKGEVIHYLTQILANIEAYLTNKQYLATPVVPDTAQPAAPVPSA